jgi:hypothetical protein
LLEDRTLLSAMPLVPTPLPAGVPGQFGAANPGQTTENLAVLTPSQTSTNTSPSTTSVVVYGPPAPDPQGEAGTTASNAATGPGQFTPAEIALAQQGFAPEGPFNALSQQTLQFLNAGIPVRLQDLPFLGTEGTGNVRLTLAAPPTLNVSPVLLAAEANGQLPANFASVGGFNRGLLTNEMATLLSGGGGVAQPPGPDAQRQSQPARPERPAPVQPAPEDNEPQEPLAGRYLAPDVGPTAGRDKFPIVLAPEREPERLPGWDMTREAMVAQPVQIQRTAPVVVAAAPPTVVAEPRAPLWNRLVSVACFAAGALGAVWYSDAAGGEATREQFPHLRRRLA